MIDAPDVGSKSASGGGGKTKRQQVHEMAEQAMAAGRDLKDKVADVAEASAESVKAQAAEFAEAAKEFASQAGETLKDRANSQKNAGADYAVHLADAIRRAAREFDDELPIAAVYMRKAAARVEEVADTVQHGNIQDLVAGVQSFARRQPTAFLGLAVLAGFGAVRFLKSSGDVGSSSDSAAESRRDTASNSTSNDDNRGYRDEFTK
ncbi:MAG: hypothetical protein HXX15_03025 [Rhodopseudomonas sp.]|nr:hypothetical protein [Rhodopseudomonas sp.]